MGNQLEMKKLIIGICILISMSGCGKQEEIKKPEEEANNKIESKATMNDLEIELIESKIENGTSEYTFEITNKASESKKINGIEAIGKDSEGNQVITLLGVIEEEIETGEKTRVTCSYGGELESVKTFEYKIVD